MERIGIRELRNQVSEIVRRARNGERMLITSNGVPVAELGPVSIDRRGSLADLADAGLIRPARAKSDRVEPVPVPSESGLTSLDVLDELRGG